MSCAISGCSGPNCHSNSVLCYAVSQDGIVWERPNLKLYEVAGTRNNNVVIDDNYRNGMAHWESLHRDPMDTDPRRRYKALGWSSYDWNGPQSGIFTRILAPLTERGDSLRLSGDSRFSEEHASISPDGRSTAFDSSTRSMSPC